jgi:hypothetical protein
MTDRSTDRRLTDAETAKEEERLNPGKTVGSQPQPPPSRRRNGAALPGSQNADLEGPKPGRGPRGMGT